ncbi:uncharacterized protein isoform X2 [Choristoneura fumiferana]|uniref:uncharacterized protein isoform X2 n=1 Tax=Choristoneura fumiferana TaxID=7141 RepID=UPI003D153F23
MRRRRPLAPARPPTTPAQRRLRRPDSRRQWRPTPTPHRTPSGGGQAHALAAWWSCARLLARWPGRICYAGALPLPPPPPQPTPCSRCKCRGARAWSGSARRGGRACDTTTGITIPQNGRSSEYRRWWGVSKRWWSRKRERGPPPRPSGSACRPAYSCRTASTGRTRICNCESLISKPS